MRNWSRHLAVLLLLSVALTGCDPEPKASRKPAEPGAKASRPPTHKVAKKPFKIEVTLKGVLEAPDLAEVALRPETWQDPRGGLLVLDAVEHGAPVKKGDILIHLDPERIDQSIRDLEAERQLGELAIKEAEEELPVLEKTTPLALAQAERAKKLADEDLKRFLDVDKALTQKSAEVDVKMANNYLDYAQEELRQLEKMYRDKDLREETEEIILKRQRTMVEMAKFMVEVAHINRDQTLKIDLPRREHNLKEGAHRLGIAWDKARNTLPLTLTQKRLSLVKLKYEREKADDKLHKLKKDRDILTVKSPADGVVYYGKCVRGKWTTAEAIGSKLHRGGLLAPEEVVLTIVKPGPLSVRATVDEKELEYVKAGARAKVEATSFQERKLAGRVERVSAIPITAGTFEVRLALEPGKDAPPLVAGMACTAKLRPYAKPDALTVPASAVFDEELDEDQHYVYLLGKSGKAEKKTVKVGKTSAGKTEILAGLKEGDEILQDKPDPSKKDKPRKDEPKKDSSDKEDGE